MLRVGMAALLLATSRPAPASASDADKTDPCTTDADPTDPPGRGCCSDRDPTDPAGRGRRCRLRCTDADPSDAAGSGTHCPPQDADPQDVPHSPGFQELQELWRQMLRDRPATPER